MPLPAVRAVARIMRQGIREGEVVAAFLALPPDLPRLTGPLLLFLFLHELLFAVLAVVGNEVPGRIVGEHLPAGLAGLLQPGIRRLCRRFRRFLRFRCLLEQVLQLFKQSHIFIPLTSFSSIIPDKLSSDKKQKKKKQLLFWNVGSMMKTINDVWICYLGASHGAGVGWHLALRHPERVSAFAAFVPGPHSLAEGAMSYRQMLMQGLISAPPPFDPPINSDPARETRRQKRQAWLNSLPEADPREKQIDYGRPLMRLGTEEKLREALSTIQTPVLILGGTEDPISTPDLMMRTARCLPHCKLVIYSNCGHNIDTDITEEVAEETNRFLTQACRNGKWYAPVNS